MPTPDSAAAPANAAGEEAPPPRPIDPATPAPQADADGLGDVLDHLRQLKTPGAAHAQDASILDGLYTRSIAAVEACLPALAEISLPIPRKPRQSLRKMQEALAALAGLLLAAAADGMPADGARPLALWRALHLLSRHLLISSLTASPPGAGIWRRLHQAYVLADRHGAAHAVPAGAARSPQDEYYAAILLGCAQPTSFTSREVIFLDAYLERFSERVDTHHGDPAGSPVTFWIDPDSDAPATPYARKPPTPETPVRSFSCGRLAALLETQLAALEDGTPPEDLDLPLFAATAAGQGVLNRLINLWGNPGKRRFPRRRQNYRGELCLGFDNLCRLYRPVPQPVETSAWMITNESPDGYAVMHLAGKTRAITVGDVAALRTETGDNWQLCIIRWALSENQEHLELGLQILSSRAYTADVALPAETEEATACCRPALVLPAAPVLRPHEALVVPSGALAGRSKNLVLVVERDRVEVREISTARCDEQNGVIELYGIVPD